MSDFLVKLAEEISALRDTSDGLKAVGNRHSLIDWMDDGIADKPDERRHRSFGIADTDEVHLLDPPLGQPLNQNTLRPLKDDGSCPGFTFKKATIS
jgi:hypothetical protein